MIQGGIITITSAAAKQTQSSNKVSLPTKIMGLVTPEKQMLEIVRISDDWVRHDLQD